MLLWSSVVACQSRTQYPVRDGSVLFGGAGDTGVGAVAVTVSIDECPQVALTTSRAEARIGESLDVVARVNDPGSADVLSFDWSAGAGFFADAAAASTTYTCPGRDQAGPQSIALTVSDGACRVTRAATIFCLALADGGGPTGGGGARGDGGAVCTPEDDPTTCEGDACNRCTNDNCDTLAGVSQRGGTPIAGCDIYVSQPQQQLCRNAYACMRDRACVQNNNPIRCWCGDVDPALCEIGDVPGLGPCRQEIFDAAGTSDAALVNLRLTDSNFPIGGAINLATCRSVYCSVLSDDPVTTACRL